MPRSLGGGPDGPAVVLAPEQDDPAVALSLGSLDAPALARSLAACCAASCVSRVASARAGGILGLCCRALRSRPCHLVPSPRQPVACSPEGCSSSIGFSVSASVGTGVLGRSAIVWLPGALAMGAAGCRVGFRTSEGWRLERRAQKRCSAHACEAREGRCQPLSRAAPRIILA